MKNELEYWERTSVRGQVGEVSSEEQAFMKDPRWCLKVAIEEASASALGLKPYRSMVP